MADFSWTSFHLLRPQWLLALLPLVLIAGLLLRKKLFSGRWQSVIDAELLPHVLLGQPAKQSRLPVLVFLITGTLAIFALAGPTWNKLPQPVFRDESALVIALDLSRSMDAGDLKPSRLTRARYKITDLLQRRRQGQTALIAYAGDAFTVSPLTDDADTIDALVPSLTTDIMPAQGSRTDLALEKALQLFKNAGVARGDIVLLTDGINEKGLSLFDPVTGAGHRISILATGTADGAPIALAEGGFLKDSQGAIVIPRVDMKALRSAAGAGGGRFSSLTADDRDIQHLLGLLDTHHRASEARHTDLQADVWREQGPWLLLLAIPLAALAFRRGYLVLLLALMVPYSPPADALDWNSLWKNPDQRGAEKLAEDQPGTAAELFRDPRWKATAHYRAGDYEQAASILQDLDDVDAHYNRGNALARQGRLQAAIEAYNQVLQKNLEHEDARYNKRLLEQQLEKQAQQDEQNGGQDGDRQQKSGESSQQEPQQGNEQQGDQQQGEPPQNHAQADAGSQNQDGDQPPAPADQARQNNQDAEQNKQQEPAQDPQQQAEDADRTEQAMAAQSPEQETQSLSEQAAQQWLRRIPDDPGGLLRRKFKYQYQRQQGRADEAQPW